MPRKTGKIKSNKTLLLVVEGETEQFYFSEMRTVEKIPGITIIPKIAKHSNPLTIIKTAINEKNSFVYDFVCCIFDLDTIINDNLSKELLDTLNEAKKLEIIFVGSLPSFEIWYLLHFCMPNKYYNSQAMLINDLRKYIPDYEKSIKWLSTARLYSKLKLKINIARERCKQLDLQLIDDDINQSCCDIDTIFELIEKKDVTLIKPNRFFKILK